MLITCPDCATQFTVPDAAIKPEGRKLKCARCGHKWHFVPAGDEPSATEPPATEPPVPAFEPPPATAASAEGARPAEPDQAGGGVLLPGFDLGLGLDDADATLADTPLSPAMAAADTVIAPPSRPPEADLDILDEIPDPIPRVFSEPPRTKPKRRWGLALFLLLLPGGLAGGGYLFQERVVALWPPAAGYYEKLGLRREIVGAGLAFRNVLADRRMKDGRDVLVIRGVVANTVDKAVDLPLLRVSLYEQDRSIQEKVVPPPVVFLDPGATTSFSVGVEDVNPAATRFEVTFERPKDPHQVAREVEREAAGRDPAAR